MEPTQEQLLNRQNAIADPKPVDLPTISPNDIGQPIVQVPTPKINIRPEPALDPLIKSASDFIKISDEQIAADKATSDLVSTLDSQPSRASVRKAAEDTFGVQSRRDAVSKYSARLAQLNAEAENVQSQIDRQYGSTDALQGFVDARANAIRGKINEERRLAAADLSAAQGDLGTALDQVDKSITDTFADRQDKIDSRKLWIASLENAASRADSRNSKILSMALAKQKEMYDQETKQIEEDKQITKDIRLFALNALANGASDLIVRKIRSAKTLDEAIQFGGKYVIDPADMARMRSSSTARSTVKPLDAADIAKLIEAGFDARPGDTMSMVASRNNVDANTEVAAALGEAPAAGATQTDSGFGAGLFDSLGSVFTGVKNLFFDNPNSSEALDAELKAKGL